MKQDGAVAFSAAFIVFFAMGLFLLDSIAYQSQMIMQPQTVLIVSNLFAFLIGALIMLMPIHRWQVAVLVAAFLIGGLVLVYLKQINAPIAQALSALLGIVAVRWFFREKGAS